MIFNYRFFIVAVFCAVGVGSDLMAATCPANHNKVGRDLAYSFTQPVGSKCNMPGYHLADIPDELVPIYNGATIGSAVTLCPGGYKNGSSCTNYAQGHCESGYYDMAGVAQSAVSAKVGNSCLVPGYRQREIPDEMYAIYNGFAVGTATTLCGADAYRSGSSCVALTGVGCPTNYKKLPAASGVLAPLTAPGTCGTGKHSYVFNQRCDENPDDDSCVLVCEDGLNYTGVGTCAALCEYGATELRTSTGVSLPLYATKETTPALNVGIGEGICYINLVQGATSGNALMLRNGQTLYHAVE